MAKFVKNDRNLWMEVASSAPNKPPGGNTAEEATINPGNCVKSLERETMGFPKHHGRLAKYSHDECIVFSHTYSVEGVFVWYGNQQEYHAMWTID